MRRQVADAGLAVLGLVVVAAMVALALTSGSSSPPSSPTRADALVVTTDRGEVRGVEADGTRTFRGIPYAAPPVGDLRWRTPQPAADWSGVREGDQHGAACLQPGDYDFGAATMQVRPGTSEDCLYLNVTRPDDDRADLPVVVWIHGGGFFGGTGNRASFASPALVERGVVLVSISYRLGRLGFFAHPALDQDVANLGLLDQVAALEWVQANAEAFGGDADAVTVMGGSAGAMSVNALLTMPSADGLIDRAIAQSAPSDAASLSLDQARAAGEEAFPDLDAQELRDLPAGALLSSTFNVLDGDAPIVDAVLPEPAADAFAAGREAPVPYLLGSNEDEFSDADIGQLNLDPDRLRAEVGEPGRAGLVAAYGGQASYDRHVLDDLVFTGPALGLARAHATRAPTFRYRFAVEGDGSGHGSEEAFVFDVVAGPDGQEAADQIADYWVAFATTGRPDVPGLPAWPAADAEGSAYLQLTPGGPRPGARDPWAERLRVLFETVSSTS